MYDVNTGLPIPYIVHHTLPFGRVQQHHINGVTRYLSQIIL